ncbi:uncharacterized protein L3040_006820 [Drepanopeziza brunnea f. sp. 'multigermtubi']|nr:hypothetical protein L3040_006820 [Drepanopeziza brunnea f. sp. 'multigermtubi']
MRITATIPKHFRPLRIFGLRYYPRDVGTFMYFNKNEDTLSFASWDDFTLLAMHNVNFWDLQANLLDVGVRTIEIKGYDELRARDYRALYMLSEIVIIALWE